MRAGHTSAAQRAADAVQDGTGTGRREGDLITGHANRSAIATLVRCMTGYTVLVHLPSRYSAAVTTRALSATFMAMPPGLRRSLTWGPRR